MSALPGDGKPLSYPRCGEPTLKARMGSQKKLPLSRQLEIFNCIRVYATRSTTSGGGVGRFGARR